VNDILSDSSPVKLGFALTLAAMAVGAVMTFTRMQAQVDRHHEEIEALNKAREEGRALSTQHEIRLRRLEDNYSAIMQSLGKLEAGVDRLAKP
jgi:uncharacterized protein HemX